MKTPKFNIFGCANDTKEQMDQVAKKYPDAWIGLVGISAGSALCINYLGVCGENTPVKAACCLCPAYDISISIKGFDKSSSFLSK